MFLAFCFTFACFNPLVEFIEVEVMSADVWISGSQTRHTAETLRCVWVAFVLFFLQQIVTERHIQTRMILVKPKSRCIIWVFGRADAASGRNSFSLCSSMCVRFARLLVEAIGKKHFV